MHTNTNVEQSQGGKGKQAASKNIRGGTSKTRTSKKIGPSKTRTSGTSKTGPPLVSNLEPPAASNIVTQTNTIPPVPRRFVNVTPSASKTIPLVAGNTVTQTNFAPIVPTNTNTPVASNTLAQLSQLFTNTVTKTVSKKTVTIIVMPTIMTTNIVPVSTKVEDILWEKRHYLCLGRIGLHV